MYSYNNLQLSKRAHAVDDSPGAFYIDSAGTLNLYLATVDTSVRRITS